MSLLITGRSTIGAETADETGATALVKTRSGTVATTGAIALATIATTWVVYVLVTADLGNVGEATTGAL